jgi:nucleoside-diphosphate-sugar epimerase
MQDTFLVTGATGFVGSHIVDALIKKRRQVRVFIRKHADVGNIAEHLSEGNVEVAYGDLREVGTVEKALAGCTVICNAAALTDLSAPSDALISTNVVALDAMLKIASKMRLNRFVQISSIGAFVKTDTAIDETTRFTPVNAYDRSKVEGEKVTLRYWKENGVPVTILEPSAVYGPRVRIGFKYLLEMLHRGKMRYPVNENTLLNMVYVEDLVQAVQKAISVPEALGERFIIGDEVSHTYKEIIELAARELGVPPPQKHVPFLIAKWYAFFAEIGAKLQGKKPSLTARYFDYITSDMVLDISKAKRILGYKPEYTVEQGIKEMVKWFKSNTVRG